MKTITSQINVNGTPYRIRINIVLLVVAILIISLLCKLGIWQLQRAAQKQQMLTQHAKQAALPPRTLSANNAKPKPYAHLNVKGHFSDKTFLIQNRYYHHHHGYQVITAFKLNGLDKSVLLDRGWAADANQANIKPPAGQWSLTGSVYYPGKPFKLNDKIAKARHWPSILPQYDLKLMRQYLSLPTYPFIIVLDDKQPASLKHNFNTVTISPAKHKGYALQWFSFALIAFISFVALSINKKSSEH